MITDIVRDQSYPFVEPAYRLTMLEAYGVGTAICDFPLPLNSIYYCEPNVVFEMLVMTYNGKGEMLNGGKFDFI